MPNTTLTSNLIIPEVIADMVETNLGDNLTLLPLAVVDNTLVGQPGDTLKFPAFQYIGKADVVAENGEITPAILDSVTVSASVVKFAKAVRITDEARLSGFGDPVGEAARQLAHSIDHAMDDALYQQLQGLSFGRLYPVTGLSADSVADALSLFGEDLDGPKVLLVDPKGFATLRKDPDYIRSSDVGQRMITSGIVGEIWGCQIMVSNKIKADPVLGESRYYILKPGALRLVNKQGTMLEVEREAKFMRDTLYASKHAAAYLYDDSKALALSTFTALVVLAGGDATKGQVHTVAAGSGKTAIVIPSGFAPAPVGFKWVYKLDDAATIALTFGTAVTGATPWVNGETAITTVNTWAHVILVDEANKPVKVVNVPVVRG